MTMHCCCQCLSATGGRTRSLLCAKQQPFYLRPGTVQHSKLLRSAVLVQSSSGHHRFGKDSSGPQQQPLEDCWPEPVTDVDVSERAVSGNGASSSTECSQDQPPGSSQQTPSAPTTTTSSSRIDTRSSSQRNGSSSQGSCSSSSSNSSSSKQPPWPPDVPWGLGKVVQVMGLWLIAYIAMGQLIVPALLALLDVDQASLSARGAALLNLCLDVGQVVVTLGILAGCLGKYRPGSRGLFHVSWQGGSWINSVAAGAACFPVVDWLAHQSLQLLTGEGLGGPDMWTAQIESGIYDRDWLTCAAYIVVVSLCAPLWEEAIFRGFLLPSLAKHLAPPAAALTSALIFALCHFKAETFAPLLLLGLVFGGLYVRCNNLLPPMVLHSLWNMYVLGTLVLRMRSGCSAVTASLVLAAGTQLLLLLAGLLLQLRRPQKLAATADGAS